MSYVWCAKHVWTLIAISWEDMIAIITIFRGSHRGVGMILKVRGRSHVTCFNAGQRQKFLESEVFSGQFFHISGGATAEPEKIFRFLTEKFIVFIIC